MSIIGLSGYHSDSAVAALVDHRFHVGVEEERFTRIKHWAGFPEHSLRFCYEEACGGSIDALEALAVGHEPKAHYWRKVYVAATHPKIWNLARTRRRHHQKVMKLEDLIGAALEVPVEKLPPFHRVEHHLAHAASAFFCCPWEEAMCITLDGFGDFLSGLRAVGRGNRLEVLDRVFFPHSLGQFYTAITQYIGFPKFGDEYKMMGLAAYGEPTLTDKLRQLVLPLPDGRFELDQSYFTMLTGGGQQTWKDSAPVVGSLFSAKLTRLLGHPPRAPDQELSQWYKDLAASAQRVYEERFFEHVRSLQRRTGQKKLALAGGCALNSLANGKLFEQTDVQDVFIQAASHDGGNSLGAALWVQHAILDRPREFVMEHSYWGPRSNEQEARAALAEGIEGSHGRDGVYGNLRIESITDEDRLAESTAASIASGDVVGWYQGRSEWGPRALGNRSILCDPRRGDMREILNAKIKRRESFRPFAPSILEEKTGDWFTIDYPDPFMLKVYPIKPHRRSEIPAVTHVDGTGRLQTVSARINPLYYRLIGAFEKRTGVPMLLNTSFNENEPIVNTPTEALDCFLRTRMDRLVMGKIVVQRDGGA